MGRVVLFKVFIVVHVAFLRDGSFNDPTSTKPTPQMAFARTGYRFDSDGLFDGLF